MAARGEASTLRGTRLLAWAVALFLFIRFISSTALVDINLSQPTLVTVGAVLGAYEVLLSFALVVVFYVLLTRQATPISFRTTIIILTLLGAALMVWLLAVLGISVPVTTGCFLVLAIASVAAGSFVAHQLPAPRRLSMRPWSGVLHTALLGAVPVIFAMRLAAVEGLDPLSGSNAVLRGNWFFVHTPTVLLEFLVVALFVNVVFDRSTAELRRRWYAFLPFLLVPLIMDAVTDRPLTGYILSAMVTWGSNLALFSPAIYSIGLATAVFACFGTALLLLGRRAHAASWDLLLLGCASVMFAGFYPSMASVAGLDLSLLIISTAIESWPP